MVNRKRMLSVCLLALFISFFAGTTLFTHTHVVNGKLITHSHPYSELPDTGAHTHTSTEFTVIASLSVLLVLTVALGILFRLFAERLISYRGLVEALPVCHTPVNLSLRGPPVC